MWSSPLLRNLTRTLFSTTKRGIPYPRISLGRDLLSQLQMRHLMPYLQRQVLRKSRQTSRNQYPLLLFLHLLPPPLVLQTPAVVPAINVKALASPLCNPVAPSFDSIVKSTSEDLDMPGLRPSSLEGLSRAMMNLSTQGVSSSFCVVVTAYIDILHCRNWFWCWQHSWYFADIRRSELYILSVVNDYLPHIM